MAELLAVLFALGVWYVVRKDRGSAPQSNSQGGQTGLDYYSPMSGGDFGLGDSGGAGMTLQEAIARQEGFLVPGSRANRNNNPGNIEFGEFAIAHGATGSDGRFAIFPDAATGFAALTALLVNFYKGLTLPQFVEKYAPSSENDTGAYVQNLSSWTGLNPDQPIDGAIG